MVYRPTVRYADEFKDYVDDLFNATTLDRNQIIRAALFTAAFSPSFRDLMKQHKRGNSHLPLAKWQADHHEMWLEQSPVKRNIDSKKEGDVNIKRILFSNQGGITIKLD